MKRLFAVLSLTTALLGCIGGAPDQTDTLPQGVEGMVCEGVGYEVWWGEDAEARMPDCKPVADATIVVENSSGRRVEAGTGEDGRFTLAPIQVVGNEADYMLIRSQSHSELKIHGVGDDSVPGPGKIPVLVKLPRAFCPKPRETPE